jgi:heme/copper-type cytochrome/quinol oxidase subunit 3
MEVSAVEAARKRKSRPNGWWGMLIFVATEATFSGMLIGAYLYVRFQHAHWPPPGIPRPEIATPLILAFVLAAMSIPLQLSYRAARAGRVARAWWLMFVPVLVQLGYFAMQVRLMEDDLQKFGPGQEAYGSVYYLLSGAHHAHVVVGILLEVFLLYRLLKGLTNYRLTGVQSTVFYWHFVNILALVVVAVELTAA